MLSLFDILSDLLLLNPSSLILAESASCQNKDEINSLTKIKYHKVQYIIIIIFRQNYKDHNTVACYYYIAIGNWNTQVHIKFQI